MSLERKYYGAVRRIKKRDQELAKNGTTAGQEAAKKAQAQESAASLSRAQQAAAVADNAKNGYQPEEREGIVCRTCGKFYTGSVMAHAETH